MGFDPEALVILRDFYGLLWAEFARHTALPDKLAYGAELASKRGVALAAVERHLASGQGYQSALGGIPTLTADLLVRFGEHQARHVWRRSDRGPDLAIEHVEHVLFGTSVIYEIHVPLRSQPVSVAGPVDLPGSALGGVKERPVTCTGFALVRPEDFEHGVPRGASPMHITRNALRAFVHLQRVQNGPPFDYIGFRAAALDECHLLMDVLRLMEPEVQIDAPWMTCRLAVSLGGSEWSEVLAPVPPGLSTAPLSDSTVVAITEIWGHLVRAPNNVRNAVRRYGLACARWRIDDQVVDLAIALESLAIPTKSSELSYKVRMRIAKYVDHLEIRGMYRRHDRVAIDHLVKHAYDARSEAVHNGKAKRRLWKVGPDRYEFHNIIYDVRELVRAALLKALRTGCPTTDEEWDLLVLSA
jgi:hypothetical protein